MLSGVFGYLGYERVDSTLKPKQVWQQTLEEHLADEVATRLGGALPGLKEYFTDANWPEFIQSLGIYVSNAMMRREENYLLLQTGGESQMGRTVRQICERVRSEFQLKVSQLAKDGVWPDEASKLLGTILSTVEFLTNPFAPTQLLSDLVFNILPTKGRVSHLAKRTGSYFHPEDEEQQVIFGSAHFQQYGEVYVSTEWVEMEILKTVDPQPLESALRMTFYLPGVDCLTFTLSFSLPDLDVRREASSSKFLKLFHSYLSASEEEEETYLKKHRGELRKVVRGHADLIEALTKFYHPLEIMIGGDFRRQMAKCDAQWDPYDWKELKDLLLLFGREWGQKRFNMELGLSLEVYSEFFRLEALHPEEAVGAEPEVKYDPKACLLFLHRLQNVVDLSSVRKREEERVVDSSISEEVTQGLLAIEEYAGKELATLEEFEELRSQLAEVEELQDELEILDKSHELRKALWKHYQKLSNEVKVASAALQAFSRKETIYRLDIKSFREALEPVKQMVGFDEVYATLATLEEGFAEEEAVEEGCADEEAVAKALSKFLSHPFEEGSEQLAKPQVDEFLKKENVNQADVQCVLDALEPYKEKAEFKEVHRALKAFHAERFTEGVEFVENDFKAFFKEQYGDVEKIGGVAVENFLEEFCIDSYQYLASMRALLEPLTGSEEAVAALDAFSERLRQGEAPVERVEAAMVAFKKEAVVRYCRFSPLLGRIGATERDTMLTNLHPYLPLIRRIGALGQLSHEEYHNLMVALENPDNGKYIEWLVKGCEEVQAQRVGGEMASPEVWLQPLRTFFSSATLPALDIVKRFMEIKDLDEHNYAMLTYLLPLFYKLETFGLTDYTLTDEDPLYRGLTGAFTVQFKKALEWIVKACQALNRRVAGGFKRDFDEVVRLLTPIRETDAVHETQVSFKATNVFTLVARIADLGKCKAEDHAKLFSAVVRDKIRPELENLVDICEGLRRFHFDQKGKPDYLPKPDGEEYEPWQKPLVDFIRRTRELEKDAPLDNEPPPGTAVVIEGEEVAYLVDELPAGMMGLHRGLDQGPSEGESFTDSEYRDGDSTGEDSAE